LSISGNKWNGICCLGDNNHTKVLKNPFIGYNRLAGIKVDENAKISIHRNKITKNFS
jgi:hypothetical protein